MIRILSLVLLIFTLVSACFFPWQVTVLAALLGAAVEPFLPLIAGVALDLLYFTPLSGTRGIPWAALIGALVTAGVFLLRRELSSKGEFRGARLSRSS